MVMESTTTVLRFCNSILENLTSLLFFNYDFHLLLPPPAHVRVCGLCCLVELRV